MTAPRVRVQLPQLLTRPVRLTLRPFMQPAVVTAAVARARQLKADAEERALTSVLEAVRDDELEQEQRVDLEREQEHTRLTEHFATLADEDVRWGESLEQERAENMAEEVELQVQRRIFLANRQRFQKENQLQQHIRENLAAAAKVRKLAMSSLEGPAHWKSQPPKKARTGPVLSDGTGQFIPRGHAARSATDDWIRMQNQQKAAHLEQVGYPQRGPMAGEESIEPQVAREWAKIRKGIAAVGLQQLPQSSHPQAASSSSTTLAYQQRMEMEALQLRHRLQAEEADTAEAEWTPSL